MVKKAKRNKKPRVTLRSLRRDVRVAKQSIEELTARLAVANKERVDFFHKIGRIEATAIEMRGESQRIADLTRTLLGRQEASPPPMSNMMVVTQP